MYLDRAKALLHKLNPKLEPHFKGCTQAEIESLESRLDVPLPAAFREYLAWFGKGAGPVMLGSSFFYADLLKGFDQEDNLTEYAIYLLDDTGHPGEELLKNALVFMEHQGYLFEFMPTDQGDNPPVYYFQEGKVPESGIFHPWADSFSDYIESLLENQAAPAESLFIMTVRELDNPYSYDDRIQQISFNGSIKSVDGSFPGRLFDFVNLEVLDLRYFNLEILPPEIHRFQHLRTLNLNSNALRELPATLTQLSQLEVLYLSHNQLSDLPAGLASMPKLKEIYLSSNPIPPARIEQLRAQNPALKVVFDA